MFSSWLAQSRHPRTNASVCVKVCFFFVFVFLFYWWLLSQTLALTHIPHTYAHAYDAFTQSVHTNTQTSHDGIHASKRIAHTHSTQPPQHIQIRAPTQAHRIMSIATSSERQPVGLSMFCHSHLHSDDLKSLTERFSFSTIAVCIRS